MKYSEKDLFDFMDSERIVRVTDVDGAVHMGQCWAYGAEVGDDAPGFKEPYLDVGCSTLLMLSEIAKIEYAD